MTTFTATSKTGFSVTRKSKTVTYTHARFYTFEDGTQAVTFHKSEQAALTSAHPHKSWGNLPRELVELTTS